MKADIEFGWISVDCSTCHDLTEILHLAYKLRGQPLYWNAIDQGVILASHFSQNCRVDFKPYMVEHTPKDLAQEIWQRLQPTNGVIVRIPYQPDMGGIGGWNPVHTLLWTSSPVCLIAKQNDKEPAHA